MRRIMRGYSERHLADMVERNPKTKIKSRYGSPLAVLAALCASLGCGQPAPVSVGTVERPNVVVILADTLRADRVNMERGGKPLMPNLARFAAQSWNFRLCRVQATWTKPSMASIFTSLYPDVHRVLFGIDGEIGGTDLPRTDVLPESLETMAEYFKANGYATGIVQTNANVADHFGFAQGFDTYEFRAYPKTHGNEVTDYAIRQLGTMSRPFFFFAHFMDTHAPYQPPEGFVYDGEALPELTDQDRHLLANYNMGYRDRIMFEVGITSKRKYGNLSKAGEEYVRIKYDASAQFLDKEIGRLIDHVLANYPNTIVVVSSDHGEELWEHGSIGHGKTVYEEVARVPLMVRLPGAAARNVDAPVESIDILPTLAAILGLPAKPEWQGRDISGEHNAPGADRPVFSSAQMSISGSNRDLECVILGHQKLVVDRKTGARQLFDLSKDPLERTAAPYDETSPKNELGAALDRFRAANLAHPLRQELPATSGLTPEQQENIRNIGYLK